MSSTLRGNYRDILHRTSIFCPDYYNFDQVMMLIVMVPRISENLQILINGDGEVLETSVAMIQSH